MEEIIRVENIRKTFRDNLGGAGKRGLNGFDPSRGVGVRRGEFFERRRFVRRGQNRLRERFEPFAARALSGRVVFRLKGKIEIVEFGNRLRRKHTLAKFVGKLSALTDRIASGVSGLQDALLTLQDAKDVIAESELVRDNVLPKMCELRLACDEAETATAKEYWPLPTYADILFSVR